MRRHILKHEGETMRGIRVRGVEVTRLEGLTDAMLGFAVTLLIVAIEPPTEFDQLFNMILGFPAFALTFLLVLFIWYWHYRYFRQYGLNNGKVMAVNGLLLFLVLIFVFPLKFLATIVVDHVILEGWFGFDMPNTLTIKSGQFPILHTLYALGFSSIFLCISWLYQLALDAAKELELTGLEMLHTKAHRNMFALIALVPLMTIFIVWLPVSWAYPVGGFSNCLMGPLASLYQRRINRQVAAFESSGGGEDG